MQTQCDLFANAGPFLADGVTFDEKLDSKRLGRLMDAVRRNLLSGGWWTLERLSRATGGPEASVSARIRDLRKERFGGHTVERRRAQGGLWEYRVLP